WRVQIVGDPAFGPGTETVTLQSALPQAGGATIAGGSITAPVVFAGRGTDADLAGRDVSGKIAVVHVRPEPSLFGSAEQGVAPKHTLMFVASGGHHGPGNGPAALLAAHPELKDHTLLVINLEHVAYLDVVRGKTRAATNTGMVWETSVTESAKAVGVTNQSPFLID